MCSTATAIKRHFFKCADCLTVGAIEAADLPNKPICGACSGKLRYMGYVRPGNEGRRLLRDAYRCACDSRCTSATGPHCSCSCGGENHGTGRVVKVTYVADTTPVVELPDSDKARAIAAEWRAAKNKAVAEWQGYEDRRRAGEWLPRAAFDRKRLIEDLTRKAKSLKTHGARMKTIGRLWADE